MLIEIYLTGDLGTQTLGNNPSLLKLTIKSFYKHLGYTGSWLKQNGVVSMNTISLTRLIATALGGNQNITERTFSNLKNILCYPLQNSFCSKKNFCS